MIPMSPTFLAMLKRDKQTFYCINGHGQSFSKSTAEILNVKLLEKEAIIADQEHAIRTLKSTLEKVTKTTRKPRGRPKKK